MISLVDVMEDSPDLSVVQPLLSVAVEAAQLLHYVLKGRKRCAGYTGRKNGVLSNVMKDDVQTKSGRQKNNALPLNRKLYPNLRLKLAQLLQMYLILQ